MAYREGFSMDIADNALGSMRRIGVRRTGLIAAFLASIALTVVRCGGATPVQVGPHDAPEPTRDVGLATPVQTAHPADPTPAGGADVATPTAEALPTGGKWLPILLEGLPLLEETFLDLILDGDQMGGFDGCNEFQSQPADGPIIAQADGSFTTPVKDILATQRGCPAPEGKMELVSPGHGRQRLDKDYMPLCANAPV